MTAPVCYVCGNEDPTVQNAEIAIVIGRNRDDTRSMSLNVQVCDRCWQSAAVSNIIFSARAEGR